MTIAAFDFDGTITKRDSLLLFLKFSKTKAQLFWGLIVLSPILLLYVLKIYPNWKAKQKLFKWFYKGLPITTFNRICQDFSEILSNEICIEAQEEIAWHKDQQNQIVIISASIENWIKPWALNIGIKNVLATKIEVDKKGLLTGRFLTKNCYGKEKVNRLLAAYPITEDDLLYAPGDSRGDKELLPFSNYPFYRKFSIAATKSKI